MDTRAAVAHADCLKSWNTSDCPVCYYIKNPELMKNSICMKCSENYSLWFCITCGHVGCGRKAQGHALEHYEDTKHEYVMKVKGLNVWDYKTEKFVEYLNANNPELKNVYTFIQANAEYNCSCPVCENKRFSKFEKQLACIKCEDCQTLNLWICLSCSHIGCGRKNNRHALQHYTQTKHPYVMQLRNFRIWNYSEHTHLYRELHDTAVVKSEHKDFDNEHTSIREDFAKRIDRLERQWREFSKLTETNEKIITIEQRLLNLTDEKRILEKKLSEHDAKLNELLTQFAGNREKPVDCTDLKLLPNRHILIDPTARLLHKDSFHNPSTTINSFNQSKFVSLNILGLFVFLFLRLCLQRIAESFLDLF